MSNGKILVTDSDENIRQLLHGYFTEQGYDVVCVPDGTSTIRILNEQSLPDLILLEFELLDLDFYEVCREIRIAPRTSRIPIIALWQQQPRIGFIDIERGADDGITKPFDLEELKLRVKHSIKASKRYS
jgi:DNA-binding response OmpR family regulator